MPRLFLHFKDLILDLQSHSASDECHLIIKAVSIFLLTSLAKRQAMSQCSNSEAVARLQVQPVASSQLFQLHTRGAAQRALRRRLLPQANKPQQNRRDACAAPDFGDRSPSYYLSCPSQGCPEMLQIDFQLSNSP